MLSGHWGKHQHKKLSGAKREKASYHKHATMQSIMPLVSKSRRWHCLRIVKHIPGDDIAIVAALADATCRTQTAAGRQAKAHNDFLFLGWRQRLLYMATQARHSHQHMKSKDCAFSAWATQIKWLQMVIPIVSAMHRVYLASSPMLITRYNFTTCSHNAAIAAWYVQSDVVFQRSTS